MVAVMKAFIEKYPRSDKVFYAFDTIGQSEVNAGKPLDAIATYAGMAEKYPENPQAPDALLKAAALWLQYARSQGLYTALNESQRAEWNKGISSGVEAAGKLLEKYPGSQSVALALQTLLDAQRLLATAKLKTDAEVEKYFQDLADKFAANPAVKSKVLFTLAVYIYEKDKARALEQMNAAYDPKLVYAPSDIDLYGGALLEGGKLDPAHALFAKLAADYPMPPGVTPDKVSPQVQEAQAIALYGTGKTLQKQGRVAEAGAKFDLLKKLYPWSPKILEANFGIAQSLAQQKKLDDATALLVQIIRAPTATAELRANAMLLGGDIQNEKGNIEAAIDYYIKIATFYQGVPSAAAEGLWKGGQLLEKQAAGLTESSKPAKSAQMAKALKAYKDLSEKYPNAPFVPQALQRIQQLGAK
jgi:TolA-binding protein